MGGELGVPLGTLVERNREGNADDGGADDGHVQEGREEEAGEQVLEVLGGWHVAEQHGDTDGREHLAGEGEAGEEPLGHDLEEPVDGGLAERHGDKDGQGGAQAEERGADPQDGVHLIELTLVAELLGLLDDKAVEDLGDDVELDAEHADRQADGEARVGARVTP